MNQNRTQKFLTTLPNLMLTLPFLQAIKFPHQNANFIYNTAIALFVIEFLTIHSTFILHGVTKQSFKEKSKMKVGKLQLFLFYIFIVSAISFVTKSYVLLAYAFLSFTTKFFIDKQLPDITRNIKSTLAFFCSVFLVITFSWLFALVIPLPENIRLSKPAGTSGLFVDTPQTILAWGLIYPILLIIFEPLQFPLKFTRRKL